MVALQVVIDSDAHLPNIAEASVVRVGWRGDLLYSSDDFDSMHGPAGYELMDADAYSDFSSFSKLMLGWYREDQVSVYDHSQGEQTFILKNAQIDAGNCVIIPHGELGDNYFSEYFIIEYSTDGGNNAGITDRW